MLLADLGRFDEALLSYDRALVIQPSFAVALRNRGNALFGLRRLQEALASYDKSIALRPAHAPTRHARGLILIEMGRFADAIDSFDLALKIQPNFAEALKDRADALCTISRFEEAIPYYKAALTLDRNSRTFNNLGIALGRLRRFRDELASYEQALQLEPNNVAAWINRGIVLSHLSRFSEALESHDTALRLEPHNAAAWISQAQILRTLNRGDDAINSLTQAISLEPRNAEALHTRAMAQWVCKGNLALAISDLERAAMIDPQQPYLMGALMHLKMHGCDWKDFEQHRLSLVAGVRAGLRVVRPFVFQAICASPSDFAHCAEIFTRDQYPELSVERGYKANGPKKLRVGYFSAEFKEHATSYLMAGVYEKHDKTQFEIIAIDNGVSDGSAMRRRLEAVFDQFLDIFALSDEAAAETIRAHEIDILVNLSGYCGFPRMGIFALRAAPIQVNYLGFPGTLGAPYMDYIIADKIVLPETERAHYAEKVVYLPYSYQANDDNRKVVETAPRAPRTIFRKTPLSFATSTRATNLHRTFFPYGWKY
jgi:protein O-GlcNAc transferase